MCRFLPVAAALTVFCLSMSGGNGAAADDALLPPADLTSAEKADVDQLALPVPKPWLGDFDAMRNRRLIRILVVNSKTLYFLDRGRELGIDKEYATALEQELNKKYKTRALKIHIALIPVARDKLQFE